MAKNYTCQGIVLKRINLGEADRLVTLFTLEQGKVVALAKGVRKLTSSRAGASEPAAESRLYLVKGRTWDLLTQAQLLDSHHQAHLNLTRMTQTLQILESVDRLTVPEAPHPDVYQLLQQTLNHLAVNGTQKTYLLEQIRLILQALGFTYDKVFTEAKLKDYLEDLANQPLRTKAYLTPPGGGL